MGDGLHEAATHGDKVCGIGQREDASDMGRGDFADGMAQQHVGDNSEMPQHPVQGHLKGKQGWLGEVGAAALVGEHDVLERLRQQGGGQRAVHDYGPCSAIARPGLKTERRSCRLASACLGSRWVARITAR